MDARPGVWHRPFRTSGPARRRGDGGAGEIAGVGTDQKATARPMSRSQSPIRRHATMNVTFQIYAHRSTGQDRAAAEQITQEGHR